MAVMMLILYLIQRKTKDAGIVDAGWASGLGLTAIFYAYHVEGYTVRIWIVAMVAAVWSFRLAYYIFVDRVLGKEEDGRYQTLRENRGDKAQLFFFFFFQFQALLVVLFSVPFLVAMRNSTPHLTAFDIAGIFIWFLAVFGESIADRQLAQFRGKPENKGKTCKVGLWRYSRHPNYFFEWLHWWTYVLIGISAPWGWITLLGPVLMLFFLFKITGIPYTEAQAIKSRGDDYREYQRTTSVFIPWFPKR